MRKKPDAEAASAQDVQAAAVKLLARREHTQSELRRKLAQRGYPEALIEAAITDLRQARLQSDTRFAEQFVSEKAAHGNGPVKIRASLRERGLPEVEIEAAFAAAEADWIALAAAAREKRFGPALPGDFEERARQARFLQQRGFAMEQIRAALKGDVDE